MGDLLSFLPALFSPFWGLKFLWRTPKEPSVDTQPPRSCWGLRQHTQPRVSQPVTILPPTPGVTSPIIFWDSSNTLPFSPLVLLAPAHPPPPFLLAGCCWAELRHGTLLCCNVLTAELTDNYAGERWMEGGDRWPGPSAFLTPFVIPNSPPNQCDAAHR